MVAYPSERDRQNATMLGLFQNTKETAARMCAWARSAKEKSGFSWSWARCKAGKSSGQLGRACAAARHADARDHGIQSERGGRLRPRASAEK
eukprot:9482465-Pyramimonas_sp.AAC.1